MTPSGQPEVYGADEVALDDSIFFSPCLLQATLTSKTHLRTSTNVILRISGDYDGFYLHTFMCGMLLCR